MGVEDSGLLGHVVRREERTPIRRETWLTKIEPIGLPEHQASNSSSRHDGADLTPIVNPVPPRNRNPPTTFHDEDHLPNQLVLNGVFYPTLGWLEMPLAMIVALRGRVNMPSIDLPSLLFRIQSHSTLGWCTQRQKNNLGRHYYQIQPVPNSYRYKNMGRTDHDLPGQTGHFPCSVENDFAMPRKNRLEHIHGMPRFRAGEKGMSDSGGERESDQRKETT